MELQPEVGRWDVTPTEAVALQRRLVEQVVLRPPPGLKVERVAGADISTEKGRDTG
ncbi:endonuclease V, partial [Pyxidicoccus fallax]|nr:endonuclease V [Pyxidicoccus fallax]